MENQQFSWVRMGKSTINIAAIYGIFFSGQIFSIANCNRLPEVFMDFWLHKIQDFSCESADYNIIESDGFYE
jgi:hypothetical protein